MSEAPLVTMPLVQSPVTSVFVPKISLFSRATGVVGASVGVSVGASVGSVAPSVGAWVGSVLVPPQAARDRTMTAASSRANSFFISFPPLKFWLTFQPLIIFVPRVRQQNINI